MTSYASAAPTVSTGSSIIEAWTYKQSIYFYAWYHGKVICSLVWENLPLFLNWHLIHSFRSSRFCVMATWPSWRYTPRHLLWRCVSPFTTDHAAFMLYRPWLICRSTGGRCLWSITCGYYDHNMTADHWILITACITCLKGRLWTFLEQF